jgi:uncharacterized protein YbbC (DUF1343 family)
MHILFFFVLLRLENMNIFGIMRRIILITLALCAGLFETADTQVLSASREEALNGADRIEQLQSLAGNKRIGLIVNQTSRLADGAHLLDVLLSKNFNVRKIFAPEHGFRGDEDAGKHIGNSVDERTGLPVVSLYGANRKPTPRQLADIDVLVFDIQDVGARFYTYISTMHYAMEAAAAAGIEFIVLDRPNPNDFVDGPVLRKEFASFVGVDPLPVLHGLTVGELALLLNGEGWLSTGANSCRLSVVTIKNWRHGMLYVPPMRPSPNLPDYKSIRLYPSLCFFEGTNISVARGTKFPFKALGNPDSRYGEFTFVPKPLPGFDTNPLYKNRTCYGADLRGEYFTGGLSLSFLMEFWQKSGYDAKSFFARPQMFDLLAGTDALRKQITDGMSESEIRASWQEELDNYKAVRRKYLLY